MQQKDEDSKSSRSQMFLFQMTEEIRSFKKLDGIEKVLGKRNRNIQRLTKHHEPIRQRTVSQPAMSI